MSIENELTPEEWVFVKNVAALQAKIREVAEDYSAEEDMILIALTNEIAERIAAHSQSPDHAMAFAGIAARQLCHGTMQAFLKRMSGG